MSPETYKAALQQARRELGETIAELESIKGKEGALEVRIVELRQTVASLARLCGEQHAEEDEMGLTDAVRLAVKTAATPMNPQRVRERIEGMGFNIGSHSNIMASIHTVLKRLERQGDVADQGGNNYRWAGESDKAARIARIKKMREE
jgi:hypothetical protein